MPRQHFKALLVLLVAVVLSATVLGPVGSFVKPVSAASFNVTISNFAFVPRNMTIHVGDTVTWINNDPVIHTLWFTRVNDSSTYLFSDPINPTASWAHTFPNIVKLKYYSFNMLWVNGSLNILPILVGGVIVPVDKLSLLAPYISLASIIVATTIATIYVTRLRSRKDEQ